MWIRKATGFIAVSADKSAKTARSAKHPNVFVQKGLRAVTESVLIFKRRDDIVVLVEMLVLQAKSVAKGYVWPLVPRPRRGFVLVGALIQRMIRGIAGGVVFYAQKGFRAKREHATVGVSMRLIAPENASVCNAIH